MLQAVGDGQVDHDTEEASGQLIALEEILDEFPEIECKFCQISMLLNASVFVPPPHEKELFDLKQIV